MRKRKRRDQMVLPHWWDELARPHEPAFIVLPNGQRHDPDLPYPEQTQPV